MPGKAADSTLPPGSASQRRCVAGLRGEMQACGNGLLGNREPWRMEGKLSAGRKPATVTAPRRRDGVSDRSLGGSERIGRAHGLWVAISEKC